jgi:poly(3-hydroxybutyrate) depolymerase
MKSPLKKRSKQKNSLTKNRLINTRFSKVHLFIFALIFGAIGAYALFHGGASAPPGASLAICAGGTCTEGALPNPTARPATCTTTPTPTSSGIPAGGWINLGNISDGMQNECRYYAVYIPNGLSGSASVLVYGHGNEGCLDNTSDMTSQGLDQLANNNRLIVVNLMLGWSSSSSSCTRPGSWYHPNADYPDPGSNVPNDYSYIQTVVSDLKARMTGSITVDAQRLWYMGLSSGGGLATGIMCDDSTSSLFSGVAWNGVGYNVNSTSGSSPTPINGTERCGGGSAPAAINKNFVVSWTTGGSGFNGFSGFCAANGDHCVPTWTEANSYLRSHFGCNATPASVNSGTPNAVNLFQTYSGCSVSAGPGLQTISVPGSGDGYSTVDDTLNGATNTNGIVMQDIFDFFVNYGGPTSAVVTPKVYVSTTGNDSTCVRGDQSKPCLSLYKAYSIAQNSDVIEMAGGSYNAAAWGNGCAYAGEGCVKYNSSLTSPVTVMPTAGQSVVINGGWDMQGVNHLIIDGQNRWTQNNGALGIVPLNGSGCGQLAGDVSLKNMIWHGPITMNNVQTANLTNVDIGGFSYPDSGSQDAWGDSSRIDNYAGCGGTSNHITMDGVKFHDIYRGDSPSHAECFFVHQIDTLLIKNSNFNGCPIYNIFLQSNSPGQTNLTIENNIFDVPCPNYSSSGKPANVVLPGGGQTDCGSTSVNEANCNDGSYLVTNWKIRFNTFRAGNSFLACQPAGDWNSTDVFYGNLGGTISGPCSGNGLPGTMSNWIAGYNVQFGQKCSPTDTTSSLSSEVDASSKLISGATAKDLVPVGFNSGCPATDSFGTVRPQGPACDAGADETTTTPDTTAPTVSVTAPASGVTWSGATNAVNATAADTGGSNLAGVQFYLDYVGNPASNKLGAEDTASPYTTNLNTTTLANGTHTITAI